MDSTLVAQTVHAGITISYIAIACIVVFTAVFAGVYLLVMKKIAGMAP